MLRSARATSKTLTESAQQELLQAILNGTYAPGSQLPTEAELGELLGVSRTVVREALRGLEDEGLIDRRHGVGTFVREQSILKNLNFNFGITEMIKAAEHGLGDIVPQRRSQAPPTAKLRRSSTSRLGRRSSRSSGSAPPMGSRWFTPSTSFRRRC